MKSAIIAAIVAALVASGTTYAATKINGRAIARHSIPADRLTRAAQRALRGAPAVFTSKQVSVQAGDAVSVAPGQTVSLTTPCPAGSVAVGGGAVVTGTGTISESRPYALGVLYPNEWLATVENPATAKGTASARADAVCVSS